MVSLVVLNVMADQTESKESSSPKSIVADGAAPVIRLRGLTPPTPGGTTSGNSSSDDAVSKASTASGSEPTTGSRALPSAFVPVEPTGAHADDVPTVSWHQ